MRGAWIIAGLTAGCFSPTVNEGAPCTTSAQCPAHQVCNPNLRCEGTAFDAGTDAALATDAPADAALDACVGCSQVVARYAFDGTVGDATGMHPGTAVGAGLTFVPGAIGEAVKLPATGTTHVRISDSPAFDLVSGSIELWFRFGAAAPAGDLGLVSRDASGTVTDGHFSVRLGHDRRVVVRIQRMSAPTVQAYRCTALPVSANAWHRIEVSFGPAGLVMSIDGEVADGTSWTDGNNVVNSCTAAWDLGIAGNDNPLILGGLTQTSVDGTGMPVTAVANTVELDEVIVRSMQ